MDAVLAAALAHRVFLHRDAWQIPVILTANYTFLNYLVLLLGVLVAGRSIPVALSAEVDDDASRTTSTPSESQFG